MILRGVGVSPGIAIGKALLAEGPVLNLPRHRLGPDEADAEVARFEEAVARAQEQLRQLQGKVSGKLRKEHSQILHAHLLMLEDDVLVGETARAIRRDAVNAEWALSEVVEQLRQQFERGGDDFFRERARDLIDVGERVQHALAGSERGMPVSDEPFILVSHDTSPSEAAQLDRRLVRGMALDGGGRTSHTGIIAKSLEIPAVVGLATLTREVRNGDLLILDGAKGEVLVRPSKVVVQEYLNKKEAQELHERELLKDRDLPALTADGHKVYLQANIDFADEVEAAIRFGAEGIGLFRSEFLYLRSATCGMPGEDEQYEVYRNLAERVYPRSAIVRTIDFGGGKIEAGARPEPERNPIMGLRAIRFCLQNRDLFKTQLRALLRASTHGRLKIMFPMVTSVTELRMARALLEEAREELRGSDVPFNESLAVGIMIEVPAAAAIADLLAREVDFFSIGTNDLIQFFLAIDRDNAQVSYLYEPMHPGVLRILKYIVDSAHAAGIRVGMCGEMAAEPSYALLLVGLGLDELSMNSVSIPLVKQIVRSIHREQAVAVATRALRLATAQEVEEHVLETLVSRFPIGYL